MEDSLFSPHSLFFQMHQSFFCCQFSKGGELLDPLKFLQFDCVLVFAKLKRLVTTFAIEFLCLVPNDFCRGQIRLPLQSQVKCDLFFRC